VVSRVPVNRNRIDRILRRRRLSGRRQIGEADAKQILAAYGFRIPPGQVARTADEAVTIATRIGFPVAMKIASPDVIHKSDVGGVRVNLTSARDVRDAFDLMQLRVRETMPDAELTGAYVECMSSPGREVILGVTRDPQFGPMLMFGLGGIFVEVMKDVSFNLAPITKKEAERMLEGTRSYALLRGARGEEAVDLEALSDALQRLSQLPTDYPALVEMDPNPFFVGPVGHPSTVADARMTLAAEAGDA